LTNTTATLRSTARYPRRQWCAGVIRHAPSMPGVWQDVS
jgi:hypothetical protein